MPLKYEGWDANPAANNAAPPIGAPEGGTRNKQVNDIMRYMMAAIWEIGDWLNNLDISLGSMALQDANAVSITGGTILNTGIGYPNLIDAGSLTSGIIPDARFPTAVPNAGKLGALTAQQWYNLIHPVGKVLTTLDESYNPNTALSGTGISATWSLMDFTAYLRQTSALDYTGSPSAVQSGGLAVVTSTLAGSHDHGGATGAHVLSTAEMPVHTHSYQGKTQSGQTSGYTSGGTVQNNDFEFTGERGGNAAHSHTIGADGAHNHLVNMTPVFTAVLAWRRTS